MKPTLLILAAGMGSRYGGLKQIDRFGPGGETIIDYSVFDALRAGFGRLVFVIRKELEPQFRETVGARFEQRIAVDYAFQELDRLPAGYSVPPGRNKPWGTTHAILMAADLIHEPFAAINADDFYGPQAYQLLADHLTSAAPDYAMVGYVLRKTLSDFGSVARGVCRVSGDNFLQTVAELTKIERDGPAAKNTGADGRIAKLSGEETVSMNCWGFTPAVFPQLEAHFQEFLARHGGDLKAECYIPSTVNKLVASGLAKVKILRTADSWFGVTYREDRSHVMASINLLIRTGAYPEKLWA